MTFSDTHSPAAARTVVLTGGSNGIGLLTARLLAGRGWTVVATGRDLSRFTDGDRAGGIVPVQLDLDALADVRAFADDLAGRDLPPLQGLICNAGGQFTGRRWSADGYEATLALNFLSPLLLIDVLAPLLRPGSRILWTASGTHNPDEVRGLPPALEDATLADLLHPPESTRPRRDGFQRYATSKLCAVRVVPHLAASLADTATVNAFDPGLMPGTGLARDYSPAVRRLWRVLAPALTLLPGAHRVSTSAHHLADLLTSPRYATMTGAYVVDDRPAGSSIASFDATAGRRLYWEALDLVGATTLATVPRPAERTG